MSRPRFSIVIPSRGGASTLPATIRSCLDQDFDDYEVIVCDNDGPPEVKQAIDSVASPRVRYVRSPRLLAMTENWDLAVSHAQGEYVTVVGNDDGLLGHALRELDRLIRQTGARAIRWERAQYCWPCHISTLDRNVLSLPLARDYRLLDSRIVIAAVLRFEAHYTELPVISSSAIHRSLLDEHRRRCEGRLFQAVSPDVYSAFALGMLAEKYLSVDLPMGINGAAARSNGVAELLQPEKSEPLEEFKRLNEKSQIRFHPHVPPLLYITEANMADGFLRAREALCPFDTFFRISRRELALRCLNELRTRDVQEWNESVGLIRAAFADTPGSRSWFDSVVPPVPRLSPPPTRIFSDFLGYNGTQLYFQCDASGLGVRNVHEAAALCEKLLHYRRQGVTYDLPSPSRRAHLTGLDARLRTRVKRILGSVPVLGPLARSLGHRIFKRRAA